MSDLIVSNRYIDSLIDYVLDVKPYHTKLSEIVEEYLFEENFNVKVNDNMTSMVVMGVDYLNKSNDPARQVWQNTTIRPDSTLNANRTIYADGIRRVFNIPQIYARKLFSESSTDTHIATNDPTEVAGLSGKVFDVRRFIGIASITRNGTALAEGTNYYVSRGAYSFQTVGATWKSTVGESAFKSGAPIYNDLDLDHGRITAISCAATNAVYEEWTLTWVAATQKLNVVGSSSGLIGTATFDVPFVHAKINFTFTAPLGTPDVLPAGLADGDQFILSPSTRINVHTTATNQTWTLINVGTQYLVYGSVTGWTANATVGTWYDNGQIAFKIPKLDYFVTNNGNFNVDFTGAFAKNAPPVPEAPVSMYEITFQTPTTATVFHNVYGYGQSLQLGVAWSDRYSNFTIYGTFVPGDVVKVYLAPSLQFARHVGYDQFTYDDINYDMDSATLPYPTDLLQEWLPLFFLKNAVIIPAAVAGDTIKINKSEREYVRLKIDGVVSPLLAADEDGWVPLDYRFNTTFPTNPTQINAFLAANRTIPVFTINQAVGQKATITFDPDFYNTYLPQGTQFTLQFHQRSSYDHVADVKFSEFLLINAIDYNGGGGVEATRTLVHLNPPVLP